MYIIDKIIKISPIIIDSIEGSILLHNLYKLLLNGFSLSKFFIKFFKSSTVSNPI